MVKLSNDVSQILRRPTPVAMATKFETKSATTRLVYEISPRSLRITGRVKLSNNVSQISGPTLVAMATKLNEFGVFI